MAAKETLLGLIHEAVAEDLLRRITSGEATPQEIAQAIKFLKDNGIEAIPTESNKLESMAKRLPDFSVNEPLHAKH